MMNGRSLSFHFRLADWWTNCPGLTQAAPRKKKGGRCQFIAIPGDAVMCKVVWLLTFIAIRVQYVLLQILF